MDTHWFPVILCLYITRNRQAISSAQDTKPKKKRSCADYVCAAFQITVNCIYTVCKYMLELTQVKYFEPNQTLLISEQIQQKIGFDISCKLSLFLCADSAENKVWHFMQIVPLRDNLHEMSNPIFRGKSKKNSLKYRLLNFSQHARH